MKESERDRERGERERKRQREKDRENEKYRESAIFIDVTLITGSIVYSFISQTFLFISLLTYVCLSP